MNQQFGKWLVIAPAPNHAYGITAWMCRCGCGVEREILTRLLRAGKPPVCQCSRGDRRMKITIGDETLTQEEWADRTGITTRTIRRRLRRMYKVRAYTMPPNKKGNQRLITVGHVTLNVNGWAERLGVNRHTASKMLRIWKENDGRGRKAG